MSIGFRAATANAGQTSSALTAIPSAVQAGDVIVAHFHVGTGNALTVPAGWTQYGTTKAIGTPTNQQAMLIYKVAGASDGGSDLVLPLGASAKWAMSIAAYSGVDGTNPIDSTSAFALETVTGTTHATPAVTVDPTNGWAVWGVSDRGSPGSTGFTISSGNIEAQSGGVGGGGSPSIAIADSGGTVPAGALAAHTWTSSSAVSVASATMFTVILQPATTSTTTAITRVVGQFNKALLDAFIAGGGVAGVPKMILLDPSFTFNRDTQKYLSDIVAHEVAGGTGYARATLNTPVTAYDSSTHRTKLSSGNVTYTASGGSITAGFAAVILDTGTAGTSPIGCVLDFGGAVASSGQIILAPDPTLGWLFGGLLSTS